MPTPKQYVAKSGAVTYKVRFREGTRSSSVTFDTLPEAERFARDIANHDVDTALRLLEDRTSADRSPTLDDVFELWLAWKSARLRSDRTPADYKRDWRNAVSPTLGHLPVASVTEGDVQRWADALHTGEGVRRRLAPKTVHMRHSLLSSVYAWATAPAQRLTSSDPTRTTSLPPIRKGKPKALRPAEWAALHRALRQINPDAADLAAFAIGTGMRWSEATALLPIDFDDDGTTMHVTVSGVMRRTAAHTFARVEDTKSDAGARRIRLDPGTAELARRRIGAAPVASRPVFTTSTGSLWRYPHYRSRYWLPAIEAANLTRRPTFHWLRHTHVLWMVQSGASLAELQARIGHASIGTTINVYGRAIADVQQGALDTFAGLLDTGRPTLPPALGEIVAAPEQ